MNSEEAKKVKENIKLDAGKFFPDWGDAKELYVKISSYALDCIVNSNIGGPDFFPKFIGIHIKTDPSCELSFFFERLKEEMMAYKTIKELEREFDQREILRLLQTRCSDLGWSDSLEIITWSLEKKKKHGSDEPYVRPEGDRRYRVNKSIKLWVMNRSWEEGEEEGAVIGIVDQIERVVYEVEGRQGLYVTYQNELYEVQDKFKLARLLTHARRGKVEFFSNEHRSPDCVSDIVPKEFICVDF